MNQYLFCNYLFKTTDSQCCIIPAFGRWKQEDQELKPSQGYIEFKVNLGSVKPCQRQAGRQIVRPTQGHILPQVRMLAASMAPQVISFPDSVFLMYRMLWTCKDSPKKDSLHGMYFLRGSCHEADAKITPRICLLVIPPVKR